MCMSKPHPIPLLPTQSAAAPPKPTGRPTASPPSAARARLGIAATAFLAVTGLSGVAGAKPFEEYIKPTPEVAPLSSATWGVTGTPGVVPRDISNGIESAMGAGVHPQWYYWDGEIIKATDGKYHMFMSTFDANSNFGTAWQGSDAYHAISQTNVLGPYVRQDYVYSTGGSTPHKGHNVSAVELPDGTYAVIVSEIVPFQIFKSSSLDGPWTGCSPQSDIGASNISMFPRQDGKYQIVERHGTIAISDTLCGHYVKQNPTCSYTQSSDAAGTIYPKRTSIPGVSNPQFTWQEDPHIWSSGGTYHVVYSGSGDRVGWHLYSPDGLSWKDNGYAWSPRDYQKIFCYDGTTTCTAWYKMERPGVVLEDGHPTHITWAVSDVDKDNQVLPGTNHGTKVIVVPFDGVAFDTDFGSGGSAGSGGAGGATGSAGAGGGGAGGRSGTGGSGGSRGGSSAGVDAGASGGSAGQDAGAAGAGGGGRMATGGQSGASGGTTSVAGGAIGGATGGAAGAIGGSSGGAGTAGAAGTTASGGSRGGTTGAAAGASGGTTTAGSGGAPAGGVTGAAGTQASLGGSSGAAGATAASGGSTKASTASQQGSGSGCSCHLGERPVGPGQLGWAAGLLLVAFGWKGRRRGTKRS